ncbi:MAG: PEP-CTERM sorting domain-containing protein [Pseudomonadota bacterium]
MKKIICLFAFLLAGSANAAVLNFDDINLNGSNYTTLSSLGQSNYANFNWDSVWFAGNTTVNNYGNASHSGTQYLSNGSNVNNLSIGNGMLFNFDGAWFASPTHSNPAEWINISAYDSLNNLIGTTGNVAITSNMSWVQAGFTNVSSLNITRGDGWFTMDDFTYNTASVPEPATLALFALGLFGFAAARRRKQ